VLKLVKIIDYLILSFVLSLLGHSVAFGIISFFRWYNVLFFMIELGLSGIILRMVIILWLFIFLFFLISDEENE